MMKVIGQFEVESGKVMVSDPCYDRTTWCKAIVDKVKCGDWNAYVLEGFCGGWGHRIFKLVVTHTGHDVEKLKFREDKSADIGVDSGQCGVFDEKYFKDDKFATKENTTYKEKVYVEGKADGRTFDSSISQDWYGMCCAKTLSPEACGVVPYGVVSSSGCGDGSYRMLLAKVKGEVVGIELRYLDESEMTPTAEDRTEVELEKVR